MSTTHTFAPIANILEPSEVLEGSYKIWGVKICNTSSSALTFTFIDEDGSTLFPIMIIKANTTIIWPIPFLLPNGFSFSSGVNVDTRVTLFTSNVGA